MNTPLFVCCTTALTLLASSPARAEPAAGPPAGAIAAAEQKDAQEEEPKVEITHVGGRRVFRITTSWVIEGRIAKPSAFYLLQRSEINFDWARMKQSFLPRIVDAVASDPF